jgi:hypothetical protein
MTDAFAEESVGELELVVEDGTAVECDLVLMPEWKTRLPTMFNPEKCPPAPSVKSLHPQKNLKDKF